MRFLIAASRFFGFWLRFCVEGSWTATFGWLGAIVPALVPYLESQFGNRIPHVLSRLIISESEPLSTLQSIGAAFALAWVLQAAFVAPVKAWWAIRPIKILVKNTISDFEIVQETLQRHSVSIAVQNRSPARSLRYTLSVAEVVGGCPQALPWAVDSGNISPRDTHDLVLARWFFNLDTRPDDKIIIFNEHPATFATASLMSLDRSGAVIRIQVRSPNLRVIDRWVMLAVDESSKRLTLRPCEPPDRTLASD